MVEGRARLLLLLAVLLASCAAPSTEVVVADLLLRGGVVHTVEGKPSRAEAVAVHGGRIVYVGDDDGAARWIGPGTEVVELDGRMVLPGFHDAHVHPVSGGIELAECDLNGCESAEAIAARIRAWAAANPEAPWVRGGGWQLPVFPGANPSRTLLDALVADRPAFLSSADGHSAWVNSAALALAGVDANTPAPPGGRLERDADGTPTGTLRESAMGLVARQLPPHGAADRVRGLRRGLELAHRFGITSLVEASADEGILAAYRELDRRGELRVRVVASLTVDPDAGEPGVAELRRLREQYRGNLLRPVMAKIFADGVIEAHTASLLEPYVDTPGDRGTPAVEPAALTELVTALDRERFQVHVHAIGDRAVRMALDAFAEARRRNGARDARHHIAHLELVDPADHPRFRALGVFANFQPLWAYPDTYITELTVPVLGEQRSRWLYPIGSLVRAGASVAFGSDWSVSSMNPLEGIQVAVTRRDPDAGPGPPWLAPECVDLETAVAAYTIGGARLLGHDRETGSIEVGKAADLVVIDRDLFAIPPQELHRARVDMTIFAGDVVYRSPR